MTETILFAGGGTGGHVFPLLAVADALRVIAPEVSAVFVGTARGIETKVVPERGYRLELVEVVPIRGGGIAGALRGVARAAGAIPEARALLRRIAPRAVFSMGGYAAGPVSVAARMAGIPLALMEPNGSIGLANRLVARLVQRAYTAYPEAERHFAAGTVLRTGVPIRSGFAPQRYHRGSALRVLVLGGSQGAQSLNDAVPRALARSSVPTRVVHQCGAGRDAAVRALYAEVGSDLPATVVPFIDDVAAALTEADLVIGRAGASAVAEICAVGRPSLLVPYPFAGDHQRHNAESIARAGAAVCVLAADATVARLVEEIERLATDPAVLPRMAAAACALGRPDAARVIARDLVVIAGISGETARGSGAPGGARGRGPGEDERAARAGGGL